MNLSIRIATKKDAVLIADISRQTFYDTFAAYNTKENIEKFLKEQFTRGRLILEVGKPDLLFLLAYAGDEVAGYMKLREGNQPYSLGKANALEIARLYSTAPMIGKGIGKLLMQAGIDTAKGRGKEVIWLSVWEKNYRAIGFYHKWGFQKFDEQDFLLGNDVQRDWLMKKVV